MAFSFSGLNAWANEHSSALDFYTEAIMDNTVVPLMTQRGTVVTGFSGDTYKLPKLSASTTMQDGDNCTFNADGSVTIGQATITLKNLKFQGTLCARDLETYFTTVTLPAGQNYTGLGQAESAFLREILRDIKRSISLSYFNETTLFDGWVEQILAAFGINAGTTTPTSGGATGTDTEGVFNIVNAMQATWLADADLAQDVIGGTAFVVMAPKHVNMYFDNLRKLQGDNGFIQAQLASLAGGAQSFTHQGGNLRIYSVPELTTSGLICLTRDRNMTMVIDLESDNTTLVTGMDQYEENFWYKLRTKFGVGFRNLDSNNFRYWGAAS